MSRCSRRWSVAHDRHRVPSVSGRSASRCRPDRVGRDPVGHRRPDGCRGVRHPAAPSHSGPPSGPLASRTGYRASSPDGPVLRGLLAWRGASPSRIGPDARRGIHRVVDPGLRHLSQRRAVGAPVPARRRVRLAAARPWLGVARHPGRGDHDLCQWSGRRRGTADGGHRDRGVRPVVVPDSDGRRRRDPVAAGRGPAAAAHRRRGPGPEALAAPIAGVTLAVASCRGTRRRHRPGCGGHPGIGGAAARCHVPSPGRAEAITADRAVGLGPALGDRIG